MTPNTLAAARSVYQLKVILCDVSPAVWRRILVPGDTYLDELHLMIQAAMGWQNCHLHRFIINKKEYARSDPDDLATRSEVRYRLQQLVRRPGGSFRYIYDYSDEGDTWETQLSQFDEEMQHFWDRLTGPGESLRKRLVEVLYGLTNWKEIRITPTGTMTIHLKDGSSRKVEPPAS